MSRDVALRVHEVRSPLLHGYAREHGLSRLVLVESFDCRHTALARMKRVRAWPVAERRRLVTASNPTWDDLAQGLAAA